MTNGKIFISYRREDTSGESGRLKDKLEQVFGQENIFYDVETLEAGLNFDQSIAKALSESKVLLAMIGPHWLKVTDAKGVRRLHKADDWVRKEIAEALRRGLRVIPVLVNSADMPDPEDLPEELKELSLKHAQELSSSRWNYDVGELTKVLEKIIAKKPQPQPHPNPSPFSPPISRPKSWWAKNYLWMIGGLVGFLILIGMCAPDETTYNPTMDNVNKDQADGIPVLKNENSEGEEINNRSQADETIPDLTGRWTGVNDLGFTYFFDISQSGESISFTELSYDGSITGNGSGVIKDNYINFDYESVFNYSGSIRLTISQDLSQLSGQVSIPSSGLSAPMVLNRN
jgi:hypothetical protein